MSNAASYAAIETLRDGRQLEIRALRPEDREELLSSVDRVSPRSRYLRFFTLKQSFSEKETEYFLNVDFENHVALVALLEETGRKAIVGGGRYVGVKPGIAEVAFVVIDEYQGLGIGAALFRHLVAIARAAGLVQLIAEVLPENKPMQRVFQNSGLPMTITAGDEIVHFVMQLD